MFFSDEKQTKAGAALGFLLLFELSQKVGDKKIEKHVFRFHFFEKVEQKLVLGKRKEFKKHYPSYTVKNLWAAANFCDLVRKTMVHLLPSKNLKAAIT